MPQYQYQITKLGESGLSRGQLPLGEEVVLEAVAALGGFRFPTAIKDIQQDLVDHSDRLQDMVTQRVGPHEYLSESSYTAGKLREIAQPLKIREIVTELVRRGLLKRTNG